MWNGAAKAGLALGAVSAAYLFISQFMGTIEIPSFLNVILTMILWAAKFGGCIWLMMFFMKQFAATSDKVTNSMTRRFGTLTAFLSALVYAAVSFANVAFLSADVFTEQMDTVMQQMAPMLDSNSAAQMEKTMQNLPQMIFFSSLIYCFIYGTLLSAIISRYVPVKDPFANFKPEDQ